MHAMLAWAARVGPWHPSLDHTGPRLAGELPYRPSWESLRHGCAAGDADGRRACGTREARCSWCCWWARRRVPFASSHLPSIVAFHASAGPYHSSTSGRLPPSRASCWSWAPRCSSVPATVPATGQGQRSRRVRGCLAPWPYCPCPRPPRLAAFPSSSASTRPVIRARAGGRVGCLVPSCWSGMVLPCCGCYVLCTNLPGDTSVEEEVHGCQPASGPCNLCLDPLAVTGAHDLLHSGHVGG